MYINKFIDVQKKVVNSNYLLLKIASLHILVTKAITGLFRFCCEARICDIEKMDCLKTII